VALWIAAFVTLFLLVFHRGGLTGTDEGTLYDQTASFAERGEVAVPPLFHTYTGRDGRIYSQYAFGQAVLALPFYAVGDLLDDYGPQKLRLVLAGPGGVLGGRLFRGPQVFTVLLLPFVMTGFMAGVFYLFQRLLGVAAHFAAVATLATILTTYLAYTSGFFLRHSAETATILVAYYCFARFARGGSRRFLLLGSTFASLTFLIRLPAGVAAIALAGFLAWVLHVRFGIFRDAGAWRTQKFRQAMLTLAAPLGVSLAVHLYGNYVRWGTLLETPYWELSGFSTPLSLGGVANLVSPGSSVFLYSPLLLLVPFLVAAAWRRERALCAAALVNFFVFWLFYSLYDHWTGLWSAPGPRYLTATIPLLLLPLGLWLQGADRVRRILFSGVAFLGLLVQISLMATHWGAIVDEMGYMNLGSPEFPFAFVLIPNMSPVLAALRFFFRGELNGMWLVQLGVGWPGFEGAPGAAWALGSVWVLALVLCGRRVWAALDRDVDE
jgi:hypothetical protein